MKLAVCWRPVSLHKTWARTSWLTETTCHCANTIKHNAAGYKSHWEGKLTDVHSGNNHPEKPEDEWPSRQKWNSQLLWKKKKVLVSPICIWLSAAHLSHVICWNSVIIFTLMSFFSCGRQRDSSKCENCFFIFNGNLWWSFNVRFNWFIFHIFVNLCSSKKVPLYVQYLLNGDCDLWGALWRSFSSQTCPVNRPNCPKQVRTEKNIQNQFCFASPKLLLFCNGRHLFLLIHQCSSPCGHKPDHHLTLPRSYSWRDEMSSASNKGICVPMRLRKKQM